MLVNNAGLQHVSPLESFADERFDHLLQVMLGAAFRLSKRALPHMYAQGWGRIVNISSVHGMRASAFKSAYVSAKHGLEGLSKTIALEGAAAWGYLQLHQPGLCTHPTGRQADRRPGRSTGIAEAEVIEKIMLAKAAIKRLIEPAEVAELAAYLCTPAASFITGTSIAMDGGWTAQ